MELGSNHQPVKLILSFYFVSKKENSGVRMWDGVFKIVNNSSFGIKNGENTMKKLLKMFPSLLPILSYYTPFP